MSKAEQVPRHSWMCKGAAHRARKWAKRWLHRLRRRAEKRDPESVEPRYTRGWVD